MSSPFYGQVNFLIESQVSHSDPIYSLSVYLPSNQAVRYLFFNSPQLI